MSQKLSIFPTVQQPFNVEKTTLWQCQTWSSWWWPAMCVWFKKSSVVCWQRAWTNYCSSTNLDSQDQLWASRKTQKWKLLSVCQRQYLCGVWWRPGLPSKVYCTTWISKTFSWGHERSSKVRHTFRSLLDISHPKLPILALNLPILAPNFGPK